MSDPAKNARLAAEAAAAQRPAPRPPVAVSDNAGPFTAAQEARVMELIAAALKAVAPAAGGTGSQPATPPVLPPPPTPAIPLTQPAPVVIPARPPVATGPVTLGPSVFKQPSNLIATWVSRGFKTLWGWEESADANGKPTVHLADYLDAAAAADAKVLVQLDAVEPIPWAHSAIGGFVQPDESDDEAVNEQDKGAAGNVEAVYVALETNYATAKRNRPDLPVYANIDGAQYQWGKPNYARIFAACDFVVFDLYDEARAMAWRDWVDRFNAIRTAAAGKLCGAFVATSFQNLGPYYPNEQTPTAATVQRKIEFIRSQGMAWPLFPQSFGPFRYDSTPADIVAVIQAEALAK